MQEKTQNSNKKLDKRNNNKNKKDSSNQCTPTITKKTIVDENINAQNTNNRVNNNANKLINQSNNQLTVDQSNAIGGTTTSRRSSACTFDNNQTIVRVDSHSALINLNLQGQSVKHTPNQSMCKDSSQITVVPVTQFKDVSEDNKSNLDSTIQPSNMNNLLNVTTSETLSPVQSIFLKPKGIQNIIFNGGIQQSDQQDRHSSKLGKDITTTSTTKTKAQLAKNLHLISKENSNTATALPIDTVVENIKKEDEVSPEGKRRIEGQAYFSRATEQSSQHDRARLTHFHSQNSSNNNENIQILNVHVPIPQAKKQKKDHNKNELVNTSTRLVEAFQQQVVKSPQLDKSFSVIETEMEQSLSQYNEHVPDQRKNNQYQYSNNVQQQDEMIGSVEQSLEKIVKTRETVIISQNRNISKDIKSSSMTEISEQQHQVNQKEIELHRYLSKQTTVDANNDKEQFDKNIQEISNKNRKYSGDTGINHSKTIPFTKQRSSKVKKKKTNVTQSSGGYPQRENSFSLKPLSKTNNKVQGIKLVPTMMAAAANAVPSGTINSFNGQAVQKKDIEKVASILSQSLQNSQIDFDRNPVYENDRLNDSDIMVFNDKVTQQDQKSSGTITDRIAITTPTPDHTVPTDKSEKDLLDLNKKRKSVPSRPSRKEIFNQQSSKKSNDDIAQIMDDERFRIRRSTQKSDNKSNKSNSKKPTHNHSQKKKTEQQSSMQTPGFQQASPGELSSRPRTSSISKQQKVDELAISGLKKTLSSYRGASKLGGGSVNDDQGMYAEGYDFGVGTHDLERELDEQDWIQKGAQDQTMFDHIDEDPYSTFKYMKLKNAFEGKMDPQERWFKNLFERLNLTKEEKQKLRKAILSNKVSRLILNNIKGENIIYTFSLPSTKAKEKKELIKQPMLCEMQINTLRVPSASVNKAHNVLDTQFTINGSSIHQLVKNNRSSSYNTRNTKKINSKEDEKEQDNVQITDDQLDEVQKDSFQLGPETENRHARNNHKSYTENFAYVTDSAVKQSGQISQQFQVNSKVTDSFDINPVLKQAIYLEAPKLQVNDYQVLKSQINPQTNRDQNLKVKEVILTEDTVQISKKQSPENTKLKSVFFNQGQINQKQNSQEQLQITKQISQNQSLIQQPQLSPVTVQNSQASYVDKFNSHMGGAQQQSSMVPKVHIVSAAPNHHGNPYFSKNLQNQQILYIDSQREQTEEDNTPKESLKICSKKKNGSYIFNQNSKQQCRKQLEKITATQVKAIWISEQDNSGPIASTGDQQQFIKYNFNNSQISKYGRVKQYQQNYSEVSTQRRLSLPDKTNQNNRSQDLTDYSEYLLPLGFASNNKRRSKQIMDYSENLSGQGKSHIQGPDHLMGKQNGLMSKISNQFQQAVVTKNILNMFKSAEQRRLSNDSNQTRNTQQTFKLTNYNTTLYGSQTKERQERGEEINLITTNIVPNTRSSINQNTYYVQIPEAEFASSTIQSGMFTQQNLESKFEDEVNIRTREDEYKQETLDNQASQPKYRKVVSQNQTRRVPCQLKKNIQNQNQQHDALNHYQAFVQNRPKPSTAGVVTGTSGGVHPGIFKQQCRDAYSRSSNNSNQNTRTTVLARSQTVANHDQYSVYQIDSINSYNQNYQQMTIQQKHLLRKDLKSQQQDRPAGRRRKISNRVFTTTTAAHFQNEFIEQGSNKGNSLYDHVQRSIEPQSQTLKLNDKNSGTNNRNIFVGQNQFSSMHNLKQMKRSFSNVQDLATLKQENIKKFNPKSKNDQYYNLRLRKSVDYQGEQLSIEQQDRISKRRIQHSLKAQLRYQAAKKQLKSQMQNRQYIFTQKPVVKGKVDLGQQSQTHKLENGLIF